MSVRDHEFPADPMPNGAALAALLSAAVGCFALGVIQVIADVSKPMGKLLTFSAGSGALSGETTVAILLWLLVWFLLHRAWRFRSLDIKRTLALTFALLAVGALLTFPPVTDLF